MAAGKVIGRIEASIGDIKIVGVDGSIREPQYGGFMYENEHIVSTDPKALFQIKFLALPEPVAYDGIFKILADGSVIHGRDARDSIASDENLVDILETAKSESVEDLETAAGEEGTEGSSLFTETEIVADSSVLGFSRGANGELGYGIVDFGSVPNYVAGETVPPAITSPNVVVYNENDTIPVIQITATAESSVTYSIAGLDSEHFNIDANTGLVTFKESPDFENPKDLSGDNEYNMYVTVTDANGNFTTQLLSVSVNNVNEPVTAYNDAATTDEDSVLYSVIDLDTNDYDIDGDKLSVVAGEFETAQGGAIVINADGSYTYTPPANFNGIDSVNYTVTDGEFTDEGKLTITVNPVNDPTVIVNDIATTDEDTSVTIDVLANDSDIEGNKSPVDSVEQPENGTVTINEDGTLTYTPNADFNGEDSFTYTNEEGNTGTVKVTVDAAADLPMLSMEIIETPKTEIVTEYQTVIDIERNEEAGIYLGEDGKYYIDTTEVIEGIVYKGNGPTLNNGHYITYEQTIELADVVVLNTRFTGQSNATVKFYEGETLVDELQLLGGLNTYTPSGSFNNIIFVVDEQTSAIFLKSYSFEQIITTEVQPYTMEIEVQTEIITYEYTIVTDAQLTDEDEELGEIELGGIPEGIDLIDNGDGTYSFESDEQLSSDILDGITASVTSTESSNGDEATITVNQNGIVSVEAGSGNDTLMGGDSDEIIDGNDGNDYIDGGSGADVIYGGAGDDTIEYDALDAEIDGEDGFDTLIGSAETINLSNVLNIDVIQLNASTTVIGSGTDLGINASDVINATDDGTLIIQSADGSASNQVNVDTTSLELQADSVTIDGIDYAQYIGGGATLLVEIDDSIEVV